MDDRSRYKLYVAIFEYIFDTPGGNYLRMKHKSRLAQMTGMTYRQISVWVSACLCS